jgi:hypothetical protein
VQFDLAASGTQRATGWVGSGDGLLALDRNGDGVINDGGELFGSATRLADGSTAGNGYEALASLDDNADGKVDGLDARFGELRVWIDADADGISQEGELKTLADLHINSLNLDVQRGDAVDHGNLIGLTSTYTTEDGASHAAADVWFAQGLSGKVSGLTQALSTFNGGAAAALASAAPAGGQLTASVARLSDALQQFSAPPPGGDAVHTEHESLRLKALQGSAAPGLLALPR